MIENYGFVTILKFQQIKWFKIDASISEDNNNSLKFNLP